MSWYWIVLIALGAAILAAVWTAASFGSWAAEMLRRFFTGGRK